MKKVYLFSLVSGLMLYLILGFVNVGEAAGKPKPPPPPPSLANSAIVYVTFDRESIKVADADGRNQATLVNRRRTEFWTPSWSPNGNWLLFTSDQDGPGMYTMKIDRLNGTVEGPTKIIPLNSTIGVDPAWSPVPTSDGKFKIAYRGDDGFYLVDVDVSTGTMILGNPFQLSTHPRPGHEDFDEGSPSWSSGASKLAITTFNNANSLGGIEVITLSTDCNDGSPVCEKPGTRRDLIDELGPLSPFDHGAQKPSWANMSNMIAVSGSGDIWIIEFDDTDTTLTTIRNLTNTNNTTLPDRHETYPTWSPDDSQIMYQGWDYLCQPQTNRERGYNLIIRNVDGTPFSGPCEEKMIVQGGLMPNWWRNNGQ